MTQINGMQHIMKKLNKILFVFILFINTSNVFAQSETINAFLTRYKTNNQYLIEYSNYISSLDNTKPENSLNAIEKFDEIFKETEIEVKDSALLIFIRFHHSIEYFTNLDNYTDFIAEDGQLNESLLDKESKKIERFGLKAKYTDGSIITIQIPGYIEDNFKNKVSQEMQKILSFYTQRELIDNIWCEEDMYKEYIEEQGKSLILLEKYLNSDSKLLFDQLNRYYIDYFLGFVFQDRNPDLCSEYSKFHIVDKQLSSVFESFLENNKESKTAFLLDMIEQKSIDKSFDIKELYYYLLNKECPDSDEYNCLESNFSYLEIENNLKEIIKYLED